MTDDVTISKIDNTYVQIDADKGILRELSDYFTFTVPGHTFMPAFKSKMWDGKIRLLNLRDNSIYYGLISYIFKFCADRDYDCSTNNIDTPNKISEESLQNFIDSINLSVQIRKYQSDALLHCINNSRVLLLSPTGSGKSLIIYMMVRYYNTRSLIIVPTISLTQQLYSDFKSYDKSWDVDTKCHIIKPGPQKTFDNQVIITTWQSIYKLPKKYFMDFNFVVGDEAHLFKAKSLTGVMTKLSNAYYRLGTTGTLDDTQAHKLIIEGLFGPVYNTTSTKDMIDSGYLSTLCIKVLIMEYSKETALAVKKMTYHEELEFIVTHSKRNNFIRNLAIDRQGNTLLLFKFVEKHGKVLYDMITERVAGDRKVFFIHGGVSGEQREEIRTITEAENNAILVASYGTFSTGINIQNLHNIIFASPTKSKIRNMQSIGRGLRKGDSKTEAFLYDIADNLQSGVKLNYTLQHLKERIKQYSEQDFEYSLYNIKL